MTDKEHHVERISFNFTYYAMKLLGKNLYSNPWTAISELVANGIDAERIVIKTDYDNQRSVIITVE